jgi:hypothetical protein
MNGCELHRTSESDHATRKVVLRHLLCEYCALRAKTVFDRRNSALLHCSGFAAHLYLWGTVVAALGRAKRKPPAGVGGFGLLPGGALVCQGAAWV